MGWLISKSTGSSAHPARFLPKCSGTKLRYSYALTMPGLPALLAGSTALWASLAVAAASADDAFLSLPTFDIPAFDYYSLGHGDSPELLLKQLQANGIVALKNVPTFSSVREAYLHKAAECAMLAVDSAEGDFLTSKLFEDGTKRHTINTNAGLEVPSAAESTQALCPGYRELYMEFSELLERAVNSFGRALDETSFSVSDGERAISSRQLVSEAVRLDHFHAYEAAQSKPEIYTNQRNLEFSLPMHEDHGLFIAMTAPKFYDVEGRRLVERDLANDASGLVIQTASGERVRPVLKEDEVVIMMGTGGSRWLQTSHNIPAVMHGMKMPESIVGGATRSLRAWFGKMTLLPAYQRLLENNDVTFDLHVNMTTRFLLEHKDDDLKTIGCATGRMLTASEGSCTYKSCSTKSGATAPSEGCATVCNREGHSATDAAECSEKCTCTDGGAGEICWMLCVATLDSCAANEQTCNSQALVCPTSASTPSPATPAPAATTKTPATTAPAAATASPSSTTATPMTTAPSTTAPSPMTSSPSSTSPSTSAAPGTAATQTSSGLSTPETVASSSTSSTGESTNDSTGVASSAGDTSTGSIAAVAGSASGSSEVGDLASSGLPSSSSSNLVDSAVISSDAGSDAVDTVESTAASDVGGSSTDSGSNAPSSSSTDSGANLPEATLALATTALFSVVLAAGLL